MAENMEQAQAFFDACESGRGWDACKSYCTENASFSSQAGPLAEMSTLEEYVEWMKGLLTLLEDGSYEIKSFAADEARSNVSAYAVFSGTHTGDGGPVPPTGKAVKSDYVYVMDFEDGLIRHMTKIWNSDWAVKELGWA